MRKYKPIIKNNIIYQVRKKEGSSIFVPRNTDIADKRIAGAEKYDGAFSDPELPRYIKVPSPLSNKQIDYVISIVREFYSA